MGSVVEDHELKHEMASLRPCSELLKTSVKTLEEIHQGYHTSKNLSADKVPLIQHPSENKLIHRDRRLPMFGYSLEDLNLLILPMVKNKLVEYKTFNFCNGLIDLVSLISYGRIGSGRGIRTACKETVLVGKSK